MKNRNKEAIREAVIGVLLCSALVYIIYLILKLTNNIQSGGGMKVQRVIVCARYGRRMNKG